MGSISLTGLDDRKWSEPGPIKPSELFLARYRRGKCHREIPDREVRREAIEIMLSPVAHPDMNSPYLKSSLCGAPPSGFAAVLRHVEYIFSRTCGGAAP